VADLLTQSRTELWAHAVADDRLFSGYATNVGLFFQNSGIVLLNPANSTKNIYVFDVRSFDAVIRLAFTSTALSTVVTTLGALAPGSGRTSVASISKQADVAEVTPTIMHQSGVGSRSRQILRPDTTILLRPGQGITTFVSGAMGDSGTSFIWAEFDK
jgi:hypothetical protein